MSDSNAFIFSITNGTKHPLIQGKEKQAIYHGLSYGPKFGGDLTVD
jgi:hypothetical protein